MTSQNRPQNRTQRRTYAASAYRLIGVAATIASAAILTSTLTAAPANATPAASATSKAATAHDTPARTSDARKRRNTKPFVAPTQHKAIATRCEKTGDNEWRISVTWKVTGGRYANLGNPTINDDPILNDNVYRGGARRIVSVENWHGFPGDPNEPVETRFHYSQIVAPVHRAADLSARRSLQDYPIITLTC